MKRVTVIILCFLFVLGCVAFAEEETKHFDINEYNQVELEYIWNTINEVFGKDGDVLPSGVYECGTDIKEGTYIIKYLRRSDSNNYYDRKEESWIGVVKDMETLNKLEQGLSDEEVGIENYEEIKMEIGGSHLVKLTRGNVLYIDEGIFRIKEYEASWKP